MRAPERTCVACRARKPQHTLLRMRRRSDGTVVPAIGGAIRGRSAYLCPRWDCMTKASRQRALERSLARSGSGRRTTTVRTPPLDVLWTQVVAAVDYEIENMKRSGEINRSARYIALAELRLGLRKPGRSA